MEDAPKAAIIPVIAIQCPHCTYQTGATFIDTRSTATCFRCGEVYEVPTREDVKVHLFGKPQRMYR